MSLLKNIKRNFENFLEKNNKIAIILIEGSGYHRQCLTGDFIGESKVEQALTPPPPRQGLFYNPYKQKNRKTFQPPPEAAFCFLWGFFK